MFDQRAGGLAPAAIDIVREEIAGAFRDKLGVSMVPGGQSYRKPYDSRFDHHPYPQGTRIPEFAKFLGDQGKNTREHIGQFLAQLGELADTEAFHVRLFSLSLTGTAFACRAGAEILVARGEHRNEAPLYYINIYSSIIHIFFIYNK
jgi:hypothetical protein